MSFSSNVKDEICRHDTNERCCLLAELAAIVKTEGAVKYDISGEAIIKITTENSSLARRIYNICRKIYNVNCKISIRKSNALKKHALYTIDLSEIANNKENLKGLELILSPEEMIDTCSLTDLVTYKSSRNILTKECCKRAYLKGAFLIGGSVSDPEKSYHLEINSVYEPMADELNLLLLDMDFKSKVLARKGSYVVYLKEGEDIVNFLNITGAHTSLMEFENVRIMKEMRNNVNRVVNCETANLQKTVNAAYRQVENIELIKNTLGFDKVPENLIEIAEIRVKYPDLNLKELGEMLTPPLGKSGVNHRLKRLDKIADKIREKMEDVK